MAGRIEPDKIREILGKENKIDNDGRVQWHRYGWLAFGAVEGKVQIVQAQMEELRKVIGTSP